MSLADLEWIDHLVLQKIQKLNDVTLSPHSSKRKHNSRCGRIAGHSQMQFFDLFLQQQTSRAVQCKNFFF